jgi:hypothetical protein
MLRENSLVNTTSRWRIEQSQESQGDFFGAGERWSAIVGGALLCSKFGHSLAAAISGPTKKLSYLAMRIASLRSSSAVNVFFSACRFNKIVSRSLSRTISPGTSAPSTLYVNLYLEGHGHCSDVEKRTCSHLQV